MATIHEGRHICERCKKAFKWIHCEMTRQPMNSPYFIVEDIPCNEGKPAHLFYTREDGNYDVQVNCPFCSCDNHFVYFADMH